LEEEINDLRIINFHKSSDDSKRGQSQILETSPFRHSVKEWIKEQRDVSFEE